MSPPEGTRLLPRFEVVKIRNHYAAYDYLTRVAHFAADPRSFTATEYVVASLATTARERKEELSLYRAENPPAVKPRTTKPKA